MYNKLTEINRLKQITSDVLRYAKQCGATQTEVDASLEDGFSVTVRMGDVETVEYHCEKGVGITVYFDHQKGSVSTSDTSDGALKKAVNVACSIAKFTEPDECAGLADANLMATKILDLELYHPWSITPETAITEALECENYARSLDQRITNSEGVSIATHQSFEVYANSHGFVGVMPSTHHGIYCTLIASKQDHMERDGDYTAAVDAADLISVKDIAKSTVKKAIKRLGAKTIPTQKVSIIFEAEVAKSLLGNFIAAVSGGNLYCQASFLCDHLGKSIFPEHIDIFERPHLLKGLGSAAFDHEGVATTNKFFIERGVLKNYVLSSYTARKLKMQTTGNAGGVHNLLISTSDMNLSQLLQKMQCGLLVTELIGQGVNLVTGDYSRGAVGFWVEDGEIQYPVSEITIAGNLRDMFANIIAVGSDINCKSNIQTGSILIKEMMIAGE